MRKEVIQVVAAVIERDGDYLLTQRQSTAVLPLLWEFPGGRVESKESNIAALIREVSGRIGLTFWSVQPWVTIFTPTPPTTCT